MNIEPDAVAEESLDAWVRRLLSDPDMLRMGHAQRAEDASLGLGWLYYALARLIRLRIPTKSATDSD